MFLNENKFLHFSTSCSPRTAIVFIQNYPSILLLSNSSSLLLLSNLFSPTVSLSSSCSRKKNPCKSPSTTGINRQWSFFGQLGILCTHRFSSSTRVYPADLSGWRRTPFSSSGFLGGFSPSVESNCLARSTRRFLEQNRPRILQSVAGCWGRIHLEKKWTEMPTHLTARTMQPHRARCRQLLQYG